MLYGTKEDRKGIEFDYTNESVRKLIAKGLKTNIDCIDFLCNLNEFEQLAVIEKAIRNSAYLHMKKGLPVTIADTIARNAREFVSSVYSSLIESLDKTPCGYSVQKCANAVISLARYHKLQIAKKTAFAAEQEKEQEDNSKVSVGDILQDLTSLDEFARVELKADCTNAIRKYLKENTKAKINPANAIMYCELVVDGIYPVTAMKYANIAYHAHDTLNKIIAECIKA